MISTDRLKEVHNIMQGNLRNAIFWWLMNLVLASTNDLERVIEYSRSQIRAELTRMRQEQLVFAVKVGWHRRIQLRFAFTREGALRAGELFFNGAIPWPITEKGLKHLLDRLPILEINNELAPTVHRQWLHQLNQRQSVEDSVSGLAIAFVGLRLCQLQWVWQGVPVVVAGYNLGGEIPFVYVDRQANGASVTDLDRVRFAGMSTPDDPAGRSMYPPHWVIVSDGAIAEELARVRLYPDESRIMVQAAKGISAAVFPPKVERVMGSPLTSHSGTTILGYPERMIDWVRADDSMLIYRDRLAGRLFSLAEDSRAARPTDAAQSWKYSGKAVRETVKRLVDAELCRLDRDGLQLAHSGAMVIARRSGLHHQTILGRYGMLGDARRITRSERSHRRFLSLLRLRLAGQSLFLELGDRLNFNPGESPSHFPNGWVHIATADGNGKLHAVELEGPRPHLDRGERRLRPYLEAHKFGTPEPLLMVFLTQEGEESCMRQLPGIWALTTTIDEALRGPDRGDRSVWRYGGRAVDISHLLTVEPSASIPQKGLVNRLRQWWGGNER